HLLAGWRQVIAVAPTAVHRSPLDHTRARERGEPLGQEVARDPRKSELDLAEAMAAVQKLAQDERRPALGEDLSPTRYRAELRVMRHVPSQRLTPQRASSFFGLSARA